MSNTASPWPNLSRKCSMLCYSKLFGYPWYNHVMTKTMKHTFATLLQVSLETTISVVNRNNTGKTQMSQDESRRMKPFYLVQTVSTAVEISNRKQIRMYNSTSKTLAIRHTHLKKCETGQYWSTSRQWMGNCKDLHCHWVRKLSLSLMNVVTGASQPWTIKKASASGPKFLRHVFRNECNGALAFIQTRWHHAKNTGLSQNQWTWMHTFLSSVTTRSEMGRSQSVQGSTCYSLQCRELLTACVRCRDDAELAEGRRRMLWWRVRAVRHEAMHSRLLPTPVTGYHGSVQYTAVYNNAPLYGTYQYEELCGNATPIFARHTFPLKEEYVTSKLK
jgi:hypothetical protein